MHAMPGEYSPSVVRPGAVPSCEKLVPGRLHGTSRHRSRYRYSQSRLVPPRWLGPVLPPALQMLTLARRAACL